MSMRRLRWTVDGGGVWEMDVETPHTMEGTACPAPDCPALLFPLGLTRGSRLSRSKQLDFMSRFMASPLVASFSSTSGISLHHADILPLRENWSATLMEKFHLQKFISQFKNPGPEKGGSFSRIQDFLHLGFGTEYLFSPDSSIFMEFHNDGKEGKKYRNKAIFTHKLPGHDLVLEAASPRLFMSKDGNYWDVPLTLSVDFSSTSSRAHQGYHFFLQHNSGEPKGFSETLDGEIPPSLLPGFSGKAAAAVKRSFDVWRKRDGKKKMLQPFDVFQCDPHLSISGMFGTAICAFIGENSLGMCKQVRSCHFKPLGLSLGQSSLFVDAQATISCQGQLGHFQKLFADLTRIQARVDFPSVNNLLQGSFSLLKDRYKARRLSTNTVNAVCPELTLSFQQQIVGPISFRAESRIGVDLVKKDGRLLQNEEHLFALEYAMQVLGSARATAWYSPKRQEAMVELRFFET